ncbi:MBL fold metallo-hydrolase [Dermacoccaceae bacterium W4C1]
MGTDVLEPVGAGVWRGQGTHVSWMLLSEGDSLTLIDSGYPADLAGIRAGIQSLGLPITAVEALLLTHAHVDHAGSAAALAAEAGCPIYVHPLELAAATGELPEQAGPWDVVQRLWRPRVARWAWDIARAGGTTHPRLPQAQPFPGTGALDLPGRPEPVWTPGHTRGHSVFLLRSQAIAVTGDALVTGHPLLPEAKPQLLPAFFGTDREKEASSLSRLVELPADCILPGHGPVWRGDIRQALQAAQTG